ncbi:MAG: hypothetical protein AAFN43_11890 [Pseudomonadota bacterium]
MANKLSACDRLHKKKAPKKVKLEYDFAGIKAGQMMFVGTPLIVDDYIRKIPHGSTRSIPALRNELARRNKCDAACPVSTSIFIRMVGEAALEELAEGKPVSEVAPFWRVLTGKDKITGKLKVDPEWVDQQRNLEKENAPA